MEGTPAIYLGRVVSKKNFRAFIYSPDGRRRLVESWEAFEAEMETGLWFATLKDAMDSVPPVEESAGVETPKPKAKPKAVKKQKPKPVKVEEIEEESIPQDELDDMVFEVKDGQ